ARSRNRSRASRRPTEDAARTVRPQPRRLPMLQNLLKNAFRRLTASGAYAARPQDVRHARLRVEALEARETPSLTPVSPTAGFPFTSIVKLVMTFPDNKVFVGSGAMIDSFHVLTAGHVTYSYADGGWARSIKVIPEMNGTYQPYGYAWTTY